MITTFIRRVLPVAGLGLLLLVVASRMVIAGGPAADTYFHLRFGREFRTGWSIDDPGHLGPFDSADWIPTQWLAQVGMSQVEDAFGLGGILWLAGALTMVLLVVVYLTCRRWADPLPSALATATCYVAAAPGLSARPQLLSYVLIAVVASAWWATARDGRPRYWLLALAWVWPMLHGLWPFGILIGVVTILGMAFDGTVSRAGAARLAIVPALSLVLSAATPLGLDAYRSLGMVGARSDYFVEWGPPDFTSASSFVLALMLALTFLLSLVRPTRMSWSNALVLGLAAAWALFTIRTGPAAAILVAPLLARAVQDHLPARSGVSRREVTSVLVLAAVSGAVLATGAAARTSDPVVPAWLDRRLDDVPAQARVLNEWDTGPYFLWRHPQLSLVMHGYGDVFTDAELERNVDLTQLNKGWDDELDELEPDYALVTADSRLGYALSQLGWVVVEGDEEFALLTPSAS